MEQYRIDPACAKEFRSKLLRRIVPVMLLVLVVALVFGTYISDRNGGDRSHGLSTVIIGIGFSLLGIITLRRIVLQQTQTFLSLTITLEDDRVTRHVNGSAPLSIPFANIKAIEEHADGTFVIKGPGPQDVIGISPYTVHVTALREQLVRIMPPSAVAPKNNGWLIVVLGILGVVLMVITYTSERRLLTAVCGTVLVAFFIAVLVMTQRSPLVDQRVKRSSWWIIALLVSLLYVLYYKVILAP